MTGRYVFLALLIVQLIYTIRSRKDPQDLRRFRSRLFLIVAQGPVFWLAFYYGMTSGVFSRQIVSPVYIGLGLLLGHVTFVLSLFITHRSWGDAREHLFDFGPVWNFTISSPMVLTRYLGGAAAEELIYRAVAQPTLIALLSLWMENQYASTWVAIVSVAVVFVLIHRSFFDNTWAQRVEFIGFAILLGALYYWTASFILVTMIHAVRNIEIAYLEYLAKVEELGDKELAAREMERGFMGIPSRQM